MNYSGKFSDMTDSGWEYPQFLLKVSRERARFKGYSVQSPWERQISSAGVQAIKVAIN